MAMSNKLDNTLFWLNKVSAIIAVITEAGQKALALWRE